MITINECIFTVFNKFDCHHLDVSSTAKGSYIQFSFSHKHHLHYAPGSVATNIMMILPSLAPSSFSYSDSHAQYSPDLALLHQSSRQGS